MLLIEQRAELDAVMRGRHGKVSSARRARWVLLWGDAERRVEIRNKSACNDKFISKWTSAFETQGLAGLVSLQPGRAPRTPVAKREARILNRTRQHKARDGSTHWSSRKLAAELDELKWTFADPTRRITSDSSDSVD